MGTDTLVRISIDGFEKYNQRTDVKKSSWFRWEHAQYFDPEWKALPAEQHHAWTFLVAYASLKNAGTFELTLGIIADSAKVSIDSLLAALSWLEKRGSLKFEVISDGSRPRTAPDTDAARKRSPTDVTDVTDGRTDETNDTNGRKNGPPPDGDAPLAFDFEALYARFPKRDAGKGMGKGKGLKLLAAQITTPEKYLALGKAVDNYAAYVAAKRAADPRWCYSVQWSTFCGKDFWTDWIDVEDPTAVDGSGRQAEVNLDALGKRLQGNGRSA